MSFLDKEQLLARGGLKKKQAPIDWDGDDHLAAGLKASKCKDVSEMMKTFHQTSKCKMYIMYKMPSPETTRSRQTFAIGGGGGVGLMRIT